MLIPDYDPDKYKFEFEDIYYEGYLVNAPIIWKVGRIAKYLHDHVFPDAKRAVAVGSELSSLLLAFSIVEYLAGFYAGKQSNKYHFMSFLGAFFPSEYAPYSSAIYDHLRNGLVHNLTLLNPWIPTNFEFIIEADSDLHLKNKDGKVVFSIKHFIKDVAFAHGMHSYLLVMRPKEYPHLIKNFERRFNRKSGLSSTMVKIP